MNIDIQAIPPFVLVPMLTWFGIGFGVLIYDVWRLHRDGRQLSKAKEFALHVRAEDFAGKVQIREDIVEWAKEQMPSSLARWIFTVHNTVLAGHQTDPSALTDSIWSHERERNFTLRYFSRNAILVGLLLTSYGLCTTLLRVAPVLTLKTTTSEAWIKAVQEAMSQALTGMSTAFYSSLLGILISLILGLLTLLFFTRRHERYIADMDSFVQGSLIPIFSSTVEQDRNDIIRESMERVEHALYGVGTQYATLFDQNQALQEQVSERGHELAVAADYFCEELKAFGGVVADLKQSSEQINKFSGKISDAIKQGLKSLEDSYNASINLLNHFQEQTVVPFNQQVLAHFEQQVQASGQLNHRQKELFDNLEAALSVIQGHQHSLQQVIASISGMSEDVKRTFSESIGRQEKIATDLNGLVGKKWDGLLTAYLATTGAGVPRS